VQIDRAAVRLGTHRCDCLVTRERITAGGGRHALLLVEVWIGRAVLKTSSKFKAQIESFHFSFLLIIQSRDSHNATVVRAHKHAKRRGELAPIGTPTCIGQLSNSTS